MSDLCLGGSRKGRGEDSVKDLTECYEERATQTPGEENVSEVVHLREEQDGGEDYLKGVDVEEEEVLVIYEEENFATEKEVVDGLLLKVYSKIRMDDERIVVKDTQEQIYLEKELVLAS
jgi:hypothetical protein